MRLSILFESQIRVDVLVPWKVEGIGGREIEDSVDLFSENLSAASLEEAEERARHMFEAIKGKEIKVSSVFGYDRNGDYLPLANYSSHYNVIPYRMSSSHNSEYYLCTIDCKIPPGSLLEELNMQSIWITAPTILIQNAVE